MKIHFRNLTAKDLANMEFLERIAWPEDVQASMNKLQDRLETFSAGFFGAFSGDHLIGMASSQIINYSLNEDPISWNELTSDGWISKTHYSSGNCLHFVSICVHPKIRNLGIATMLNRARLSLAKELRLDYALTDARIPGFHKYLNQSAQITIDQYIREVISGKILEPVVKMYLTLGFNILGIVADCMKSDIESSNYGLALIKDLRNDFEPNN